MSNLFVLNFAMRYRLNVLFCTEYRNALCQKSRRYAGHSKWQNIKHIKQENDAARATLFRSLTFKMRAVIGETGNADPSVNPRLAQLINQAKKANMPIATLNTFLEKMKNPKKRTQSDILTVRCPGGCVLAIFVSTDNMIGAKMEITNRLKKHNAKSIETSVKGMFDCATYIIASKDCNLDAAMEDAIEINAEDVEEVEDNDKIYFQFKCEFLSSDKARSQLTNLGYSIISVEDACIPNSVVELTEEDLSNVEKLKEKLLSLDDVDKIDDNIA